MSLFLAPEVEALLQAEADSQGKDVAAVIAVLVNERYVTERERAEARALLNGPSQDFAAASEKTRRKYGMTDLSPLSAEELSDYAEATLSRLEPEKRVEAERLGLL